MALTSNKENANADNGSKEKKELPPTKVIVRRLPPTLTSDMFLEQISPIPKHDYFCYFKADMSLGAHAYSRAYINFVDQEDLIVFTDKFDGYVFVDAKGNEYPAVMEFAPFQKVPKRKSRKVDSRKGTIEQDAEYKTFLEKLENPEHEPLPSIDSVLEEIEAREKEKKASQGGRQSTPLLDYIKKRREERRAMLLKVKEEKRRKELERKKSREEERRRQKDAGHGRVVDKDKKDEKRSSKEIEKKEARSRSGSEKEKSSERDVRSKDRDSKERDSKDGAETREKESKEGRDSRERKTSASDDKRQKGDITVRVLRNPEREKYASKPRDTPKPKDGGKSDHHGNRPDDRNNSGSRGNTPRGDKSVAHGNRPRDEKSGRESVSRESPGNDRPIARDGNRGNRGDSRPNRSDSAKDGHSRPRDDGNKYGGRQNQDRRQDKDFRRRDDRQQDAGRQRSGSGSANKDRVDKSVKDEKETSAAAAKSTAVGGTNEAKSDVGQTSSDVRMSSDEARKETKRNSEADRLRRTRNKDRPEREIYVPGRRRMEVPGDKKPSAEKESKPSNKGDEKGES